MKLRFPVTMVLRVYKG